MKWNNWLFTNYIHHIESYDHTNWCWAELECEATVERFGTAGLSRLVSSPNVKSVSEKCRLHTHCLDSFLACCALQGMPSLSVHSRVLCKNGTREAGCPNAQTHTAHHISGKGYGCTLRGVEGHTLLQLLDFETGRMALPRLNPTVSWPWHCWYPCHRQWQQHAVQHSRTSFKNCISISAFVLPQLR